MGAAAVMRSPPPPPLALPADSVQECGNPVWGAVLPALGASPASARPAHAYDVWSVGGRAGVVRADACLGRIGVRWDSGTRVGIECAVTAGRALVLERLFLDDPAADGGVACALVAHVARVLALAPYRSAVFVAGADVILEVDGAQAACARSGAPNTRIGAPSPHYDTRAPADQFWCWSGEMCVAVGAPGPTTPHLCENGDNGD